MAHTHTHTHGDCNYRGYETYCATFLRISHEFGMKKVCFVCLCALKKMNLKSHFHAYMWFQTHCTLLLLLNWAQIYGRCDLCGQVNCSFLTLVCNSLNLRSKSHFSISPSELKMEWKYEADYVDGWILSHTLARSFANVSFCQSK